MHPEISHRCPSCGASIRQPDALFCPECGQALSAVTSESEQSQTSQPETTTATSNDHKVAAGEDAPEPAPEAQQTENQLVQPLPMFDKKEETPMPADPKPMAKTAAETPHRRGEKTRERLHRASGVARGVIEQPVKQVEKIRQVSSVMIEEASYDPSLRFVLVAAGLFILFIILLVLSKLMG